MIKQHTDIKIMNVQFITDYIFIENKFTKNISKCIIVHSIFDAD